MLKLDDKEFNREYYQTGVYESPIHHMDDEKASVRLFIAKALAEYLLNHNEIKSVLDLGCGDGSLIDSLYDDETEFTGVDLSTKNIEYATNLCPAVFLSEDITRRENRADLIIICETLEHLSDPILVLNNLKCSFIIASVPLNERPDKHSEGHLWGWTKEEFAGDVSRAGFSIVHHIQVNDRTQLVVGRK